MIIALQPCNQYVRSNEKLIDLFSRSLLKLGQEKVRCTAR